MWALTALGVHRKTVVPVMLPRNAKVWGKWEEKTMLYEEVMLMPSTTH